MFRRLLPRAVVRHLTPDDFEARRLFMQKSSWADGLRGIAAVYVMFSHMTLAFARFIVPPSLSQDGPSLLFQKPVFRLIGQGAAWVALFIILSGFVNALKPIKQAESGQADIALAGLATSSIRRSFRLFLPALAATVISWFICQFGVYEIARNSDAYWLAVTSPAPSPSWGVALDNLITAVRDTWVFNPENPYDQPQWALIYLLLGSMYCFTILLTTMNMTRQYRVCTLILCWFWGWNWDIKIGAPYVAIGIFFGILCAELFHSEIPAHASRYSLLYTPPLLLLSLVLMSFPSQFQQQAQWSRFLFNLHNKIFGERAFIDRTWPTIGSMLLTLTIIMSPEARRFLSHRIFLWLGKISFPLYLLHGTFMRTILTWMLFANQQLADFETDGPNNQKVTVKKYPLPSAWTFVPVLPVFFVILFTAAHFWAEKVEPYFGHITKRAEDHLCGRAERSPINPGISLKKPVLPVRQERPD